MADATQIWLSVIGATCGGVGLKFIESWLSRGKTKFDDATQIRNELRIEITSLRDQVNKANSDKDAAVKQANSERDKAEADADAWRDKYYDLLDKLIEMKGGKNIELPSKGG